MNIDALANKFFVTLVNAITKLTLHIEALEAITYSVPPVVASHEEEGQTNDHHANPSH